MCMLITLARYCGYVKVYKSILYVYKTVALIHMVLYTSSQAPTERHQVPQKETTVSARAVVLHIC